MIESELQDLEENPHDLGKIKKSRLSVVKLEHLYEQSVFMQSVMTYTSINPIVA